MINDKLVYSKQAKGNFPVFKDVRSELTYIGINYPTVLDLLQVIAAVMKADKGGHIEDDDIKPQSSSCTIL